MSNPLLLQKGNKCTQLLENFAIALALVAACSSTTNQAHIAILEAAYIQFFRKMPNKDCRPLNRNGRKWGQQNSLLLKGTQEWAVQSTPTPACAFLPDTIAGVRHI
jgi:hypothetical protein